MPLLSHRHEHVLGVGLLIAALCVSAGITYRQARQLREDTARVTHTHEVLTSLEHFSSTLAEAESALRAFVINGEVESLGTYSAARHAAQSAVEAVAGLTQDNLMQQEMLARLETLMNRRLDAQEKSLELRRSRGFDMARESIATEDGQLAMAEIRTVAGQMVQLERELLKTREVQSNATYRSLSM